MKPSEQQLRKDLEYVRDHGSTKSRERHARLQRAKRRGLVELFNVHYQTVRGPLVRRVRVFDRSYWELTKKGEEKLHQLQRLASQQLKSKLLR